MLVGVRHEPQHFAAVEFTLGFLRNSNLRELDVQAALTNPDEIRLSRSDTNVYLFYKSQNMRRWVCAVAKQLNADGFLITTYSTDAIKEGEQLWPK